MLSSRSDFVARICQHMMLSTPSRNHGLVLWQNQSNSAGNREETRTTTNHKRAPATFSPQAVFGNTFRSPRSRASISFPIRTTGCGNPCGSPTTKSIPKPMIKAAKASPICSHSGMSLPPRPDHPISIPFIPGGKENLKTAPLKMAEFP